MKLHRIAVATAVLALGVAACAGDRSQGVRAAETRLTNAQIDAEKEQIRLEQKQAKERGDALTKQLEEKEKAEAKGKREVAEAKKDVAKAHADVASDRTKVDADAKARLTKADAKLDEAKTKAAKLTGDKRTRFDADVKRLEIDKREIEDHLSKLNRAADKDYTKAKESLEKSLHKLESTLDHVVKDL